MKPRGLTLLEMLMAMSISLTLLIAVVSIFQAGERLFLSALDAVALSDFRYRVPREIVQKLTASSRDQITPGTGTFQFATAYDQYHQFQLSPEGLPIWQGKIAYFLSAGQLMQKEPWETVPRPLLRHLTQAWLEVRGGAYVLGLQTNYQGYTRSYRGEVWLWASPVN
ncbi:MAG: prepilin-type N-terminal cleavage/methylation domain-containing protein [Vulcanimicrobiota bacterium]